MAIALLKTKKTKTNIKHTSLLIFILANILNLNVCFISINLSTDYYIISTIVHFYTLTKI